MNFRLVFFKSNLFIPKVSVEEALLESVLFLNSGLNFWGSYTFLSAHSTNRSSKIVQVSVDSSSENVRVGA